MIKTEETAGGTASAYTDEFIDAAIAKIDGAFGKGFAKQNPALVGAYINSCSTNLSTVLQASLAAEEIEGMLTSALEQMEADPDEDLH